MISMSEDVVVSSSSPDVCPLVCSDSTFTMSERLENTDNKSQPTGNYHNIIKDIIKICSIYLVLSKSDYQTRDLGISSLKKCLVLRQS